MISQIPVTNITAFLLRLKYALSSSSRSVDWDSARKIKQIKA